MLLKSGSWLYRVEYRRFTRSEVSVGALRSRGTLRLLLFPCLLC